MKSKRMRRMCFWLFPILCAAVVLVLMKTVFLFGYVPTASMEPTLPSGSYILGYRLYGPLEKGGIIIFTHDGKVLVKRIFALPGENVTRADGTFLLVPEGCYYVLGDNSDHSVDSRYCEDPFVKSGDILATLLLPQ